MCGIALQHCWVHPLASAATSHQPQEPATPALQPIPHPLIPLSPPPPLSLLNDHSGRGTSHHTTCSLPTCKALQIEKVAHDQGPQCIHQGCCSCTPPLPAPRGSTARSRGQCSVNKKRLPWEGINSGTVALRDCVLSLSTLEDDSYEPANCGLKQSSP